MPTKTCPKCKKQNDPNNVVCPFCAYDFSAKYDFFKKIIPENLNVNKFFNIVIIVIMVIVLLYGIVMANKMIFPTIGIHVNLTGLNWVTGLANIVADFIIPIIIMLIIITALLKKIKQPQQEMDKEKSVIPPAKTLNGKTQKIAWADQTIEQKIIRILEIGTAILFMFITIVLIYQTIILTKSKEFKQTFESETLLNKPPVQQGNIYQEIDQCAAIINNMNVSRYDARQNSLICFKGIAINADKNQYKECLNFDWNTQAFCLAAFAKVNNDINLCAEAKIDRNPQLWCVSYVAQSHDDCNKLTDSFLKENCLTLETIGQHDF